MSRKRKNNELFKGIDITLMSVLSFIALSILVFSGTLIWLLTSM